MCSTHRPTSGQPACHNVSYIVVTSVLAKFMILTSSEIRISIRILRNSNCVDAAVCREQDVVLIKSPVFEVTPGFETTR